MHPAKIVAGALALGTLVSATSGARATPDPDAAIVEARQRWAASPHGPMLERVLPPTFARAQLPQRDSPGAQLIVRYCVQCHNLPNPAMHDGDKWPKVVERMVLRMLGKGNMGSLMRDMMAGVAAPAPGETRMLLAYLRQNAMRPLDRARYRDIDSPQAQAFRLACSQCHVLPDPGRYTAREWPAVVDRMVRNMAWMNRVVGTRADPDEPQLRIEDIIAYLGKHARKD